MFTMLNNTPLNRLMMLGAAVGACKAVEATATGNPLAFQTDLARPLKSLLIPFTPVQSGTGDPSPSNVRPIVPWDGLKVYHSGADTSNPTETDISFPSPVYGGTLDVVTGELWATWFVHNFLWSDKWYGSELTNVERRAFKLPNGIIPHTMSYYNDHKSEIKCNIAPLLWSYTADNTHYYVDKDGDYYRALVFLPIGTSEDTQIQVGGTLADPVLITTLTPEQITALVGDNTIWSDADGSMTAVYLKKG